MRKILFTPDSSFYCLIFAIAALFFLSSCKQNRSERTIIKGAPAFYHWKTVFAPAESSVRILQTNRVQDIYVRFFDVDWNDNLKAASPIAQVRITTDSFFIRQKINIIPTIFITNECIAKLKEDACAALAAKIVKLVGDIIKVNSLPLAKEIQIDCDWTASTRPQYFSLLQHLQEADTSHIYSATIRLFQVKYKKGAGVPPVKKGLLMCYNMGNLKNPNTKNSILDPEELKKYTGNLAAYPLPLDVALPLFSWHVLFRKNEYVGLLQNLHNKELEKITTTLSENIFIVSADTVCSGFALKKGDRIRYENSNYNDIMQAAGIIKEKLNNPYPRLSLYHLDSIILSKYSSHEIKNIFNSLN